jgi:hypothetical protein
MIFIRDNFCFICFEFKINIPAKINGPKYDFTLRELSIIYYMYTYIHIQTHNLYLTPLGHLTTYCLKQKKDYIP